MWHHSAADASSQPERQGHPDPATEDSDQPSYLGIRINEATQEVTRNGATCHLTGLSWKLFKVLLGKGPDVSHRDALEHCWGGTTPRRPSVYSAVSKLRNEIKPLGLVPKADNSNGYRLLDDPSPSPIET